MKKTTKTKTKTSVIKKNKNKNTPPPQKKPNMNSSFFPYSCCKSTHTWVVWGNKEGYSR